MIEKYCKPSLAWLPLREAQMARLAPPHCGGTSTPSNSGPPSAHAPTCFARQAKKIQDGLHVGASRPLQKLRQMAAKKGGRRPRRCPRPCPSCGTACANPVFQQAPPHLKVALLRGLRSMNLAHAHSKSLCPPHSGGPLFLGNTFLLCLLRLACMEHQPFRDLPWGFRTSNSSSTSLLCRLSPETSVKVFSILHPFCWTLRTKAKHPPQAPPPFGRPPMPLTTRHGT